MRITSRAGIGCRLRPESFWNIATGPNWAKRSSVLPLIGPSVAMPTGSPAARIAVTGAMPRPALAFERALWATQTRASAIRAISASSTWRQWAQTRPGRRSPARSTTSTGRAPYSRAHHAISLAISARWICTGTSGRSAAHCATRCSTAIPVE